MNTLKTSATDGLWDSEKILILKLKKSQMKILHIYRDRKACFVKWVKCKTTP